MDEFLANALDITGKTLTLTALALYAAWMIGRTVKSVRNNIALDEQTIQPKAAHTTKNKKRRDRSRALSAQLH